jgi:hypothetical protein
MVPPILGIVSSPDRDVEKSLDVLLNSPNELDVSCFQLPVGVVVHARNVDGYGSVAFGVVVGRKVDVVALPYAVFLVA